MEGSARPSFANRLVAIAGSLRQLIGYPMTLFPAWQQLAADLSGTAPGRCSVVTLSSNFRTANHLVSLVFNGGTAPIMAVKIARSPDTENSEYSALARECRNLQALSKVSPASAESVPAALELYSGEHGNWLAETALLGKVISPRMVQRDHQRIVRIVTSWLTRLHSDTAHRINSTVEAEAFQRRMMTPLHDVGRHFAADHHLATMLSHTLERTASVFQPGMLSVFEHGDLSHPNLLLADNNKLGVLDWEEADPQGLPAVDLFFFL
ncbi:MAG TPA: phosphotransferase, partial [Terriglobales bacterium]|nr:phosphotransferase [Terriglobales bacterium]